MKRSLTPSLLLYTTHYYLFQNLTGLSTEMWSERVTEEEIKDLFVPRFRLPKVF